MKIKEHVTDTEEMHTLPRGINVPAFISQLGDQNNHSVQPEIIVLKGGREGTSRAKFIPSHRPR